MGWLSQFQERPPWWLARGLLAPPWRIKAIYLAFFAGQGSVLSFMPIFFRKAHGLSFTTVGTLGMLSPLARFVGAPLLGAVVDHADAPRFLLLLVLTMWLTARCLLLIIEQPVLLGAVYTLGEFVGSAALPTVENGVLAVLASMGDSPYGKVRLHGALGYAVGCFSAGAWITLAHAYWPMFLQQALYTVLAVWALWTLPLGRFATKQVKSVVVAVVGGAEVTEGEKATKLEANQPLHKGAKMVADEAIDAEKRGRANKALQEHPPTAEAKQEKGKSEEEGSLLSGDALAEGEGAVAVDLEAAKGEALLATRLTSREKVKLLWSIMTRDRYAGRQTWLGWLLGRTEWACIHCQGQFPPVASHTVVFFSVIVIAGLGAGVIDNYLFLFIDEVSGRHSDVMQACRAPLGLLPFSKSLFQRPPPYF
jgi:hypothetical protein